MNFKHINKLLDDVDYNRLDHSGLQHTDGRFVRPQSVVVEADLMINKAKNLLNVYVYEYWNYIKIIIFVLIVLIILVALIRILLTIINCFKSKNKSKNQNQVNLIKGFLPDKRATKQLNVLKKQNTTESIDPVTLKLLSKIEKTEV